MQNEPEKKGEEQPSLVAKFGSEKSRAAIEVTEEAREEIKIPSFGAQLFMGTFNSSMLYPFPEQDPADKKIGDEYIAKISKYITENIDPLEVDRTGVLPKEYIKGLAELGAFALKIPKEYGGMGFSQTNYNRISMAVSSYDAGTGVLLSAHQSIGVPQPLKMFGTEEQKRKYYPRFVKGEISGFALTEADVGSDPARMSCEAKLSEDGKFYILNGSKLWCTNGPLANVIVVLAKTAPKIVKGKEKKQITAFILEMNTPGVEVTQRCEFMGLHGMYNGALKFTDVKIPIENRIDKEGRGLAIALATINVGRLTIPAACAGGAKQLLSIARRWGKSRVQWGQPIGMHEEGRQKISYIAATTFAIESIAMLTSNWQDKGEVDIRIEGAMAKLFCTEALWRIVDQTMQLRGGRGYETARSLKARGETPYPVEQAMRDSRINLIFEGSSEIMRLFLAREALDLHFKKASALLSSKLAMGKRIKTGFETLGFYLKWYPSQFVHSMISESYSDLGPLAKHFKYVEKNAHKLARKVFYYMAMYREKLESRQLILGRLIEIGVELFAISATVSHAASLLKKNPTDRSPLELADYFVALARRRIEEKYQALSDNDDKQSNALAEKVLNGDMKWLEEGVIKIGPQD